jgi:hypothetical protein
LLLEGGEKVNWRKGVVGCGGGKYDSGRFVGGDVCWWRHVGGDVELLHRLCMLLCTVRWSLLLNGGGYSRSSRKYQIAKCVKPIFILRNPFYCNSRYAP